MADDTAYIPPFVVADPVLTVLINASNTGRTADGNDPWVFLNDTIKAHQGLVNPAFADTDMTQQEIGLVMAAASGAGAAVASAAVYPLLVLAGPAGWLAAAIMGGMAVQPRTCRVILVNLTDQDLIPDADLCTDPDKVAWLDCGHVAAKPAVPQEPGKWLHVGVIPRRHRKADGTIMAGVGCYVFQKDNFALTGTGGVLPFKRWDIYQPALGWLVPQNGDNSTASTFDLAGDGGTRTLYDKYVDHRRQAESHVALGKLWFGAALWSGKGDSTTLTACIYPVSWPEIA